MRTLYQRVSRGVSDFSPARLALLVFSLVVMVFTALLSLPIATSTGERAPLPDALFTATSAVCVTGLVTVDTATYWSPFGEGVITVAIKLGGLGVLSLASLLTLAVSRRLGLRQKLLAASETKAMRLGDVRRLLITIAVVSVVCELTIAATLFPRFLIIDQNWATALWHSVFYGVSSFNNAGFVSHPGGLPAEVVGDWLIAMPIAIGVFVGALGVPVQLQILRDWRHPQSWDLHTRLTLKTTFALLFLTIILLMFWEWNNPKTLGELSFSDRILALIFTSVMPRSGGFNIIDTGSMIPSSWLTFDVLMFVGGGSSSTAGGIKVSTFAVLILAAVAEARGNRDIEFGRRRIPTMAVRVAITLLFAGSFIVWAGTIVMLRVTDFTLDQILFEVISAFATVGLSTGITPYLPDSAKYLLSFLMFLGRTGLITLAAAVAVRSRATDIRYPEETPIIG